jgi:ubiquitin-activating enzyme E1
MASVKRTKCDGVLLQPSAGGFVLDEDLNSRNLFVYGSDAMSKMVRSSVAVVGLNGVGAEAAKALILANIGAVTLVDDALVSVRDLSTHFYLADGDIGLNRAVACHRRLQELNPDVEVRVHPHAVTPALLAQQVAVIVCDGSLTERVEWNELCRKRSPPVAFVLAEARGACFRLFSDFGDEFQTMPGDKPYCCPIAKIESAAGDHATVTVSVAAGSGEPSDGDAVVLSDVQGATQSNGLPTIFHVKNCRKMQLGGECSLMQFDIDIKGLLIGACAGKGHVKRAILPVTMSFSCLSHALQQPGPLNARAWRPYDVPGGRSEQLHVAFAALNTYMERSGGLRPNALDSNELAQFLDICRSVYCSFPGFADACGSMDEALMCSFARSCGGLLNPIAAIAGAFAAQEAIKRCSQKYMPVCNPQWLYYDALDVLPDAALHDNIEFEPLNCRYDDQITVLGRSMHALLGTHKVFVVGAGAIGCEILKNFAMMGVACADGGLVTVTDNDHIEKSNLSRQFLFRSHHIKQSKSKCARESVQLINPLFK